jgi:RimJ/RimL family protein N-acetyltransferase
VTEMSNHTRSRADEPVARAQEIRGNRLVLRPAIAGEMRQVYEWLANSDSSAGMSGPPIYPERAIPTWAEFCDADAVHYFDDSALLLGRCYLIVVQGDAVGQVTYNDINQHQGAIESYRSVRSERSVQSAAARTELDIWMRSEKDCGQGLGTEALELLCRHLADAFAVQEFMVQPSARNPRAIRAYEKIGFKRLEMTLESARELWGPNDYIDSVYMVRKI